MKEWKSQEGMTLVEVLITIAILAMIVVPLTNIFITGNNNLYTNEALVQLQFDARLISGYISQDIRNATNIEVKRDANADVVQIILEVADQSGGDEDETVVYYKTDDIAPHLYYRDGDSWTTDLGNLMEPSSIPGYYQYTIVRGNANGVIQVLPSDGNEGWLFKKGNSQGNSLRGRTENVDKGYRVVEIDEDGIREGSGRGFLPTKEIVYDFDDTDLRRNGVLLTSNLESRDISTQDRRYKIDIELSIELINQDYDVSHTYSEVAFQRDSPNYKSESNGGPIYLEVANDKMQMSLINDYTWEIEVDFANGEEFKFSNGDSTSYGSDGNPGDSDRGYFGTAVVGGDDITVPDDRGNYLVRFNDETKEYFFVKMDK